MASQVAPTAAGGKPRRLQSCVGQHEATNSQCWGHVNVLQVDVRGILANSSEASVYPRAFHYMMSEQHKGEEAGRGDQGGDTVVLT